MEPSDCPFVRTKASVGNGDLTLAAEILTLLQVWGLVSLMLEAPLVPAARSSLRLVGRTAADTLRGRADAPSRELAVDTLLAGATFGNLDSGRRFKGARVWRIADYPPAINRSKRGLPRSGAKVGSILSQPGER